MSPRNPPNNKKKKIVSLSKNTLKLNIPEDRISRAHRIFQFTSAKCRPITVKFSTPKTKELVLSKRALKDSQVAMNEDFSLATRNARKKFTEYGKRQNAPFKLRHNKLVTSGKRYGYSPDNDSVYEIGPAGPTLNAEVTNPRTLSFGRLLEAND